MLLLPLTHIAVQTLKYFPSHGVVVGVQVDFDHVVNSILTPIVVLPGFVEVLQSIVRLSGEPEHQGNVTIAKHMWPCSEGVLP